MQVERFATDFLLSDRKIIFTEEIFDFARNFLHLQSQSQGEMLEWLKRHAWKACIPQKGISGSNPDLSAKHSLSRSQHRFRDADCVLMHHSFARAPAASGKGACKGAKRLRKLFFEATIIRIGRGIVASRLAAGGPFYLPAR